MSMSSWQFWGCVAFHTACTLGAVALMSPLGLPPLPEAEPPEEEEE